MKTRHSAAGRGGLEIISTLMIGLAGLALAASPAAAQPEASRPAAGCALSTDAETYRAQGQAGFAPVAQPGTQRRIAQNEAERKARLEIYRQFLAEPAPMGGGTMADVLLHDSRLRARVLDLIRTAEIDWQVDAPNARVQVCAAVLRAPLLQLVAEYQQATEAPATQAAPSAFSKTGRQPAREANPAMRAVRGR